MKKVVFFSNYLNHHQLPFCKEIFKLTSGNFHFVAQKAISEKRLALGYKIIADDYDFVVKTYESKDKLEEAFQLAYDADYVLFGSSDTEYLRKRLRNNKLTIKYSERLFRKDLYGIDFLKAFRRVYINHGKYRNKKLYMLCNGIYAAYDFNRFGAYNNKTYKWGYFPETKEYQIEDLKKLKNNGRVSIIWVGRFLKLKHPEYCIEIAKRLKKENLSFSINIIGQGELEDELNTMTKDNDLLNDVHLLGSMNPEDVRKQMEKADIFIFTSDKQEGWGAVLNEAMNSGCACIASHAIGSTGFLIKHRHNGYIYKDGDFNDLYSKVRYLIGNKEKREEIGINAYKTIAELWNAKVAAERFLNLCEVLEKGEDTPYLEGPCSKALPIKEKDMYDYLVKE